MSGNKFFVDTNIVLYLLSGDKTLAELLNGKQLYLSFISQLELLGYIGLTARERKIIEDFLSQCVIIDINNRIKTETITIRQKYKIKLPDSIIIASSLYLDIPLITADSDFKSVDELSLIFYHREI